MSGRPNREQVERVILVSRTIKLLNEEERDLLKLIAESEKRIQLINSNQRKLNDEREALLSRMDVSPDQRGNCGYEARFAAFLNLMATCHPVGFADEPFKSSDS